MKAREGEGETGSGGGMGGEGVGEEGDGWHYCPRKRALRCANAETRVSSPGRGSLGHY